MVDKLYHRANPRSSLRPIAHFVVEIQRFVYDRTIPPTIELRSKGVAMHAYSISAYYTIKWPWAGPFEMNVKIEQGSNFVVQNDSRLFFDAQEA